jgi:hypothetical protein
VRGLSSKTRLDDGAATTPGQRGIPVEARFYAVAD